MILLIHEPNSGFVREASKRGIFAYLTDGEGEEAPEWQNAIDIVLRRFTEYYDLEGAFGRRTVTERAKGILMERIPSAKTRPSSCSGRTLAQAIASSSTSPPRSSMGRATAEQAR